VSNYVGATGHWVNQVGDEQNTGVLYGNSRVKTSEIIDGLGTTILVGERDMKYCRGGAWVGIRNPQGTATRGLLVALAHSRAKINEVALDWDDDPLGCGQGFSSLHSKGVQVAMCDGAVRFLDETIGHNHITSAKTLANRISTVQDPRNSVYQRLMSRSDTLQVTIP
jgi:prepilin-type processing-associated H-X9-DG protein